MLGMLKPMVSKVSPNLRKKCGVDCLEVGDSLQILCAERLDSSYDAGISLELIEDTKIEILRMAGRPLSSLQCNGYTLYEQMALPI